MWISLCEQLYAMGIRNNPEVEFDEGIVVQLMEMYQDQGNHIALQYAGSQLVFFLLTISVHVLDYIAV